LENKVVNLSEYDNRMNEFADNNIEKALDLFEEIGFDNYYKMFKKIEGTLDDVSVYLEVENEKLRNENERLKILNLKEQSKRRESDGMLKHTLPNSYLLYSKINLGIFVSAIVLYICMIITNNFFVNPRLVMIGILGSLSMTLVFRSMKKEWEKAVYERISRRN